jgi:3-oxoacyl-[acyl-carrier protein] reductase
MNLKGKVVFLTGASLGIGASTARMLAKEGCILALTYCKDKRQGQMILSECKELTNAELFHLDISDEKSIKKCVKAVVKKFKKIDILINNAGVIVWKPFAKQSWKEIEWQIGVNLFGTMRMTKECLPYVKDVIINVASAAGQRGHATLAPYCASKFGIRGFSQSLAGEIKQKVVVINPTVTATRMTGFSGMPPENVANVIISTLKGKYKVKSGGDVNVWDYY